MAGSLHHGLSKVNFKNGGANGNRIFTAQAQDMKSEHIPTRRLYEAVTEKVLLEQADIEHLRTCEECLELIRLFVRQILQQSKRE